MRVGGRISWWLGSCKFGLSGGVRGVTLAIVLWRVVFREVRGAILVRAL